MRIFLDHSYASQLHSSETEVGAGTAPSCTRGVRAPDILGSPDISISATGIVTVRFTESLSLTEEFVEQLIALRQQKNTADRPALIIFNGITGATEGALEKMSELSKEFSVPARALVVEGSGEFSVLARHFLQHFIRFCNTGCPQQLFGSEADALKWLQKFVTPAHENPELVLSNCF